MCYSAPPLLPIMSSSARFAQNYIVPARQSSAHSGLTGRPHISACAKEPNLTKHKPSPLLKVSRLRTFPKHATFHQWQGGHLNSFSATMLLLNPSTREISGMGHTFWLGVEFKLSEGEQSPECNPPGRQSRGNRLFFTSRKGGGRTKKKPVRVASTSRTGRILPTGLEFFHGRENDHKVRP